MKKEDIKQIYENIINKSALPIEIISFDYNTKSNSLWMELKSTEKIENRENRISDLQSAINYLGRKIIERSFTDKSLLPSVVVDINGIEKKRIESLQTTAHMMAERAKFFKKNVELEPMNPFARRIVHEFLQDKPNIRTNSTGEGRQRRVVIEYIEE